MRLDEWQKYLDAQFLDEKEAPVATAKKQVATPKASASPVSEETVLPLTLFADDAESAVAASPESPTEVVTTPDTARVPESHRTASRGVSSLAEESASLTLEERLLLEAPLAPSDVEQSEEPTPHVAAAQERRGSAPSTSRQPTAPTGSNATSAFVPLAPAASTIPGFDRYLPASHAASSVRSEEIAEAVVNSPLFLIDPNTVSGPSDVLMPMTEYGVSNAPACSPQSPSIEQMTQQTSIAEAKRAARRSPTTRAPHARNVIPEKVSPGLSAAELWAEVPRHVQTLLALGRMEDEKEIAQFSYKRPFQEKRNELIARLLDPILSLEEAARLLNVCPTTVRRYTNKGILNHYRKDPEPVTNATISDKTATEKETRQRRFRLSDILTFLEAQQAALEADKQNQTGRRTRVLGMVDLESRAAETQHTDSATTSERHLAS